MEALTHVNATDGTKVVNGLLLADAHEGFLGPENDSLLHDFHVVGEDGSLPLSHLAQFLLSVELLDLLQIGAQLVHHAFEVKVKVLRQLPINVDLNSSPDSPDLVVEHSDTLEVLGLKL